MPKGKTHADFAKPKFTLSALVDNLQSQVDANEGANGDALAVLSQSVAETSALDRDRNRLTETGKARLLQALAAGNALALGFEHPRKRQDVPIKLEASDFGGTAHFRWDLGTLRSHGLHTIEVRFISAERAEGLAKKLRAETHERTGVKFAEPAKPVGRPTVKPQIEAAFNTLLKEGSVDTTAPMNRNYIHIRQWLAVHCSELNVTPDTPNDETIRRIIKPLFDQAKKQ
ncbi:hypothetical protein [Aliiroseovarius marinus]|uniref:hypothetical protein n=1 Tax=Aliiroseovarius marinus TaxID=2500159 RepID=UPI003D7C77B5